MTMATRNINTALALIGLSLSFALLISARSRESLNSSDLLQNYKKSNFNESNINYLYMTQSCDSYCFLTYPLVLFILHCKKKIKFYTTIS